MQVYLVFYFLYFSIRILFSLTRARENERSDKETRSARDKCETTRTAGKRKLLLSLHVLLLIRTPTSG